jgi:hypothetical protein
MTLSPFIKDAFERVSWTALSAGITYAGVYVTKLPMEYVPIGTVLLTIVKTLVAQHVGDKSSAAIPLIKGPSA